MRFPLVDLNVIPYSVFNLNEADSSLNGNIQIEVPNGEIPPRTQVRKYMDFIDIYNSLKMSRSDLTLLKKMDEEFGKIWALRDFDWNREILNSKEERDKFLKHFSAGKKYNPVFKHNPSPYRKNGMIEKAKKLLDKFKLFDCFLSEYYIEVLEFLISYGTAMELDKNGQEYVDAIYSIFPPPSKELVHSAEEMIKDNPYEKILPSERTIDAKKMKSLMEGVLKELGYDKWKVKIVDNIIPRMNVQDEYIVKISDKAKFSEDDFIGLVEHEIKGHVGRRWYGDKTGLSLFRCGMNGRDELDEGIATYNSLYKVINPKPNVKFDMSFFVLLCDQLPNLDFYSLFEFGKKYISDSDKTLFNKISRVKRLCQDTSVLVGDTSQIVYLSGFLRVDNMNDSQRSLIHKFNIGPSQYSKLDEIKSFLRVNGFIGKNF